MYIDVSSDLRKGVPMCVHTLLVGLVGSARYRSEVWHCLPSNNPTHHHIVLSPPTTNL